METWRDKIKTVNEQNLKNVQIKKNNCVKDAFHVAAKKNEIFDDQANLLLLCREMSECLDGFLHFTLTC